MIGQTNAKIAGGGGVTEDVIVDFYATRNDGTFNPSAYSGGMSTLYLYKSIDNFSDEYAIGYGTQSPGGGSQKLTTVKRTIAADIQISEKSSILLDFGQYYAQSVSFYAYAGVSPDKKYVAVCGVISSTKIFVVALTKDNNEDYIFDTSFTTLEIDTGVTGNSRPIFVTNDTFVAINGTSLGVYKIENGTLTLVKTITLDITPTMITTINGYVVVASSSKIEVVDIDTKNILYSETISVSSLFSTNSHIVISTSSTSVPFCFYSVSGQTITKETFTFVGDIYVSVESIRLLKEQDNKSFLYLAKLTGYMDIQALEIDFTNKTVIKTSVSGRLSSSTDYQTAIRLFNTQTEVCIQETRQGSSYAKAKYDITYQFLPLVITYNNGQYSFGVN